MRLPAAAASAVAAALVVSGCADFSGSEAAPFSLAPTGEETTTTPPPTSTSSAPKPKGPCIDQDTAVIATCLTDPMTVLSTQTTENTYVAQRGGDIVYTTTDEPNAVIGHVDVDTSTDGGLMSIALSPYYAEDRLIYAYITTPSDNRVVRFTPGDAPKPILTGIPRGASGNVGSLLFTSNGTLVVATGNAGDPAAAANPASLAGKVLAIDSPTAVSPARPRQIATGVGSRASLCQEPSGGPVFVAERGADSDVLRAVTPGGGAPSVVWTWPAKPGLDGCAVTGSNVYVSEQSGPQVESVRLKRGTTTADAEPGKVLGDKYGRIGRLATGPQGVVEGATRNKAGGRPVPTDDRVVLIPSGSSAGESPD